jgi:hypothetical protein
LLNPPAVIAFINSGIALESKALLYSCVGFGVVCIVAFFLGVTTKSFPEPKAFVGLVFT